MRLVPYIRRTEAPLANRLFEEFFNDFPLAGSFPDTRENWNPAVDILEKDGNLILRAELPGMTEKQIDLKLEGNTLTLKGDRKFVKEVKEENYHRVERSYGAFQRAFTLPGTVQHDRVKAKFKDGILEITLPKVEQAKPKQIKVDVG